MYWTDWSARRDRERRALRQSLGLERTREHGLVEALVTGRSRLATARRENLLLHSRPGVWLTAHLYIPRAMPRPYPAVLWTPEPGESKEAAEELLAGLAGAGILGLAFDAPDGGERLPWYSRDLPFQAPLVGECEAGLRVQEAAAALSALLARPEAQPARVGLAGGWVAAVLGALEDRWAGAVLRLERHDDAARWASGPGAAALPLLCPRRVLLDLSAWAAPDGSLSPTAAAAAARIQSAYQDVEAQDALDVRRAPDDAPSAAAGRLLVEWLGSPGQPGGSPAQGSDPGSSTPGSGPLCVRDEGWPEDALPYCEALALDARGPADRRSHTAAAAGNWFRAVAPVDLGRARAQTGVGPAGSLSPPAEAPAIGRGRESQASEDTESSPAAAHLLPAFTVRWGDETRLDRALRREATITAGGRDFGLLQFTPASPHDSPIWAAILETDGATAFDGPIEALVREVVANGGAALLVSSPPPLAMPPPLTLADAREWYCEHLGLRVRALGAALALRMAASDAPAVALGLGGGGAAALLAAAAFPSLAAVAVVGSPVRFRELLSTDPPVSPAELLIPNAIRLGDLPSLVGFLAPRPAFLLPLSPVPHPQRTDPPALAPFHSLATIGDLAEWILGSRS